MMKRHAIGLLFVAAVVVAGAGIVGAQAPAVGTVVKLDPALDPIISSTAKVQMLKEDYFGLSEGPVWVPGDAAVQGYLLFSDIGANVIYKWTSDNKMSVFLDKSGFRSTLRKRAADLPNTGRHDRELRIETALHLTRRAASFTAQGDRAIAGW